MVLELFPEKESNITNDGMVYLGKFNMHEEEKEKMKSTIKPKIASHHNWAQNFWIID